LIDYNYTPLRIRVVNNYSEWRYYHSFQDEHFVYDPNLVWRPKKGAFVFNSQGYRGKEISIDKKPGEFRIFAIGDSNTLGWYGDNGPNWPMYLQELLVEKHQRSIVVNAGVYGYSSFQGLRRFREALPFQPDMVLISFGGNDAMRVTESDMNFASRRVRTLKLDTFLHEFRVGQLLLAFSDKAFSWQEPRLVPRVDLKEYKNNLTETIRLSKERKIKPVLLTRPFVGPSPNEWWWKNFAPAYNVITQEVAKENSIPVIDVYSYFAEQKRYFVDESHFNEEGHRLMARMIYDRITPLIDQPFAESGS
jgi:lysophospholipase L1-like esterase